jgi:tape measure domain-containing protein
MLNDAMSNPLKNISKALNIVINNMERVAVAEDNMFDIPQLHAARDAVSAVEAEMQRVEQQIQDSVNAQNKLNDAFNQGEDAASGLLKNLRNIAGAYLTMQTVEKVVDTSDTLTLGKQRLELFAGDESVDELNQKIMASATLARAAYTDTLNQVAKLGTNASEHFDNNDQIIKFVEQFNKLATLSGASVYESSQAMYQLTQSMAKGKLDGDELRSVMEGMPLVAKQIAKYLNVDVGTMKEMAAEGLVTAEVVRNALLTSANETDETFKDLGYTWGQVGTLIRNGATQAFQPLLNKINEIVNNKKFQEFVNDLVSSFHVMSIVATGAIDAIGKVAEFCYDNFEMLLPLIAFATTLMVIGALSAIAHWAATSLATVGMVAYQVACGLSALAVGNLTMAQTAFNAALYACPVTWIIAAVVALIVIIVLLCNWIAETTELAQSGIGLIAGALMIACAFVANLFVGLINVAIDLFVELWNFLASFVNFFASVFNDLGGSIARLFLDLVDTVLGVLEIIVRAMDAVFGQNLGDAVDGWRSDLEKWSEDTFGKGTEVMAKINSSDYHVGTFDYGEAFKAGTAWGDGIASKFKLPDFDDLFNMDELLDSSWKTAYNTDDIANTLEITSEELEYLRDIAEQEAINRFTTIPLTVTFENTNNVNNEMDLDGVTNYIEEQLIESIYSSAEVAHY